MVAFARAMEGQRILGRRVVPFSRLVDTGESSARADQIDDQAQRTPPYRSVSQPRRRRAASQPSSLQPPPASHSAESCIPPPLATRPRSTRRVWDGWRSGNYNVTGQALRKLLQLYL